MRTSGHGSMMFTTTSHFIFLRSSSRPVLTFGAETPAPPVSGISPYFALSILSRLKVSKLSFISLLTSFPCSLSHTKAPVPTRDILAIKVKATNDEVPDTLNRFIAQSPF